ncbi:MAG: tetratricopeptide repeat protein, partial [Terriglobales bacterium]
MPDASFQHSRKLHFWMTRPVFFVGTWLLSACLLFSATPASAQTTAGVETSPQLFAVMCALHAAGYEAEVGAAGIHPLRVRLRSELLKLQGPATEKLRTFYREHQLGDPGANLSRYVSFAMVVGPPPRFEFLMRREDFPPDVLAIEGFREVLTDFYLEAGIEKLWEQLQPYYEREVNQFRGPVGQIVLVATSYLREIHRPMRGRKFVVYVEPLVGGKTNVRRFHDPYSIVLSPSAEIPTDDIRHAYRHYFLDPLPFRYRQSVTSKQALHRYAGRAGRLAPEYRDDFEALVSECLVRAVELRLRKLPPARLTTAIDDAEREGYILVRAFYAGLDAFEKSEPAMGFFFPDLMNLIDVGKEAQRLEKVQFAAAETPRETPEPPKTESELDSWLREGDVRIAAQDGAGAAGWFERVLEKYPGQPRALYGLAVAKVLLKQGEEAKALFQRIVTAGGQVGGAAAPDPMVLAWSHVYLGRIHDVEGNRDLALSEYKA